MSKFEVGKYYVHTRFKDCFIEILQLTPHKAVTITKYQLWNLGFTGQPWLVPSGSRLPSTYSKVFLDSELQNWTVFCPYSDWKALRSV